MDFNRINDELYTVIKLAEAVKVRRSTIQHWINVGLLKPAAIGENKYRLFDRMSLVRAKEIKRLRDERLTIMEIKEKLG
jgi:DNA-binding transcriptional MerR regulator